jgi:hypothetical protein
VAIQGNLAVDGSGQSHFQFKVGTVALITIPCGDNRQINITECNTSSVKMGGATQNWTIATLNEASSTVGQVALSIDVSNDNNVSCTIRIPGADDQHVNAGDKTNIVYINKGTKAPHKGVIHEQTYEVRRTKL